MGSITKSWFVRLISLAVGLNILGPAVHGPPAICEAQTVVRQQNGRHESSWTDSISSGMKKGVDGFAEMITPKPKVVSEEDPIALSTKAEPSAKLYLAVARLFERSSKPAEAQKQYQSALKHEPNNLAALLGYARLKDRLGQPKIALQIYLRAVQVHPNDPSVRNNLALLHARQGRLPEAVASLQEAIRLQPRAAKYRNNMATVLVEMGRPEEALLHLQAVHGEPVANYNLGYLLEKQGNHSAALRYFAVALSADPTLTPARQAVDRLAQTLSQPRQAIATRTVTPRPNTPQPVEPPAIQGRIEQVRPVRPPSEQVSQVQPPPITPRKEVSVVRPVPPMHAPQSPPRTPPAPPAVHLPPAPDVPTIRPPQVVLPEPSSNVVPPRNVAPSAPPRLESPGEPVARPHVSLPQVRLLPPPPSGYQPRRPLPKATGLPSVRRLPNATAPRRLPPITQNLSGNSGHPNTMRPPNIGGDAPALRQLPPAR